MREHHPMRYHRMTEILKTVASVKLSSTFLLKVRRLHKYQVFFMHYLELLSKETASHVNGSLLIQRICRRIHCFRPRATTRKMHG